MRTLIKHAKHGFKHKPYHMTFLGVLFFGSMVVLGIGAHTIKSFADPSPPFSLSAPPLNGTAAVGQTMTVDPGGWTGNPTFTFQWQSCNSSGSSCVDINAATSNAYTLTSNEAGHIVQAIVTATEAGLSTPATSEQSGIVQAQLGDINGDGAVNMFDLGMILGKWGLGSNITLEDIHHDGTISQADLDDLFNMYAP